MLHAGRNDIVVYEISPCGGLTSSELEVQAADLKTDNRNQTKVQTRNDDRNENDRNEINRQYRLDILSIEVIDMNGSSSKDEVGEEEDVAASSSSVQF